MGIFENYCKQLFNKLQAPPAIPSTIEKEPSPIMQEVEEGEVLNAIEKQKSKACSYSGMSPFHIKELKNELVPILTLIFNNCVISGTFPQVWLELVMFFIHKKGGRNDPNNYRSIAVENPIYKIFSTILYKRLTMIAELLDLSIWICQRKKYVGSNCLTERNSH